MGEKRDLPERLLHQSPHIEHCELDSQIMSRRVGRITTGKITGKELTGILSRLKKQEYTLVYWQTYDEGSECLLPELTYRGEKLGTNISYFQPVDGTYLYKNTSAVTPSADSVSPGDLNQLVEACARYSHLSRDPRIEGTHVYGLFNGWLEDGLQHRNNRYILLVKENGCSNGLTVYTVENQYLHINLFAIAEEFQQKGYGTQLIRAVRHEAFRNGCTSISIVTQENNLPARSFYVNTGFKEQYRYQIYHFWL